MVDGAAKGIEAALQQRVDQQESGDAFWCNDAHGQAPAARQYLELGVEEVDQDQAEPEHRHRDAADGDRPRDLVDRAVLVDGRQHAEWYAQTDRDEERDRSEFQCCGQEGANIGCNRAVGPQGRSQIALQEIADIDGELFDDRAIQTQVAPDVLKRFGACPIARNHARGISRNEVRDREGDDRDPEHHKKQQYQTRNDDAGDCHGR
ncbi:hypothetical protein D9M70_493840 [compost metagenome]